MRNNFPKMINYLIITLKANCLYWKTSISNDENLLAIVSE